MSDQRIDHGGADPDAELLRMLDAAAETEASERAEAERTADAPGARHVDRVLREQWDETSRTRWSRPRIFALCAAAAALVALVVIWNRSGEGEIDGPSGQYLNDGRAHITIPAGRVGEWPKKIVWTADDGAREYDVDVLDYETGRVVSALGPTIPTEIEVPSEESAKWPSKIEIRVKVLRKDGSQSSVTQRVELVK